MKKLIKALEIAIQEQKTKTHVADKLLSDIKSGKEKDIKKIKSRINKTALSGKVKSKLCKMI